MNGYFPDCLTRVLNSAETVEQNLFVPAWAPVYECRTIEEFNAVLEAEILILNVQFRFNACAHGDWVSPHVWYRINSATGNEDKPEYFRPLSSWLLKDPVGFVPSLQELEEEVRWRRRLVQILSTEAIPNKTIDELHTFYVREACKDVTNYKTLLWEWFKSGLPCDQEEWTFNSTEERKGFRARIKQQRFNLLEARQRFEIFRKTGAPEFLTEFAAGQSLQEKRILDQMHQALNLCS